MAKQQPEVKVQLTTTVTTKKSFRLELENEDLIQLLRNAGLIPKEIQSRDLGIRPHPWDEIAEEMGGICLYWEQTTKETT